MGCDIHIYTERLNRDKEWVCQDYYEINPFFDKNEPDDWEQEYTHKGFYSGRNYELFTALAGVRGKGVSNLEPKGFPSDASKQCSDDFITWDSDAHTPSYLTLKELRDHQKDIGNTVKRSGMISKHQNDLLKEGIKPSSWCGWTNQDGFVNAEWEDEYNPLDGFIAELDEFIKTKYYQFEIDKMDESQFRVVFWFDN